MELIEKNQRCANCGVRFPLTDRDLAFYRRLQVPPPQWCPQCREMRRMAWCNENVLYQASCAKCARSVVAQFPASGPRTIFCIDCWWGDAWSGEDYAKAPDFSRSFFEQFHELELRVPHACVATDVGNENSEYTHHAGQERNCYYIFHATFCEDCYYGYGVKKAKDCVDVHNCFESEFCFECVDVDKCYELAWSQDCFNCATSCFLRDCIGCTDCYLCVGLRNKCYCWMNEQLTKEEYLARLRKIDTGSRKTVVRLQAEFARLEAAYRWKALRHTMVEHSSGDYLINARHADHCFDCRDVEECKYCSQLQLGARHCYDMYQFGVNMELCYEGAMVGTNAYNVHFSALCIWQVSDLNYCMECYTTSNCLLCFGLKRKKFCILNKEYTEAEYRQLSGQIIRKMAADKEYGEFFPLKYSQFGYNETTAMRWFPLTEEEVRQKGWRWSSSLPGTFRKETVDAVPDSIGSVGNEILNEVLRCTSCGRNYRLIAQELAFYRRHNVPLPVQCFECRRTRRMLSRNPRQLWESSCALCAAPIVTSFSPESKKCVVCDKCYHARI
ncbi:MAG TPA: hypothetical protein PLP17_00800 [Oligoflexia bacterium]|nr:hypothetical protein [Oligoflexia bacterium]